MHLPTPPILAASQEDIIAAGVAVVIIAGSWIFNAMKGWRRRNAGGDELQSERIGEAAESPEPGASGTPAEDLATRRREQLRELARQRAQAAGRAAPQRATGAGRAMGPQQPAAQEPTNLTMAERIARARAQQQYAERSQKLSQRAPDAPHREQPQPDRDEVERRQRQMQAEQRRREQQRTKSNEATQRREAARQALEKQRAIQRRPERPAQFSTPRIPDAPPRASQPKPKAQAARQSSLSAAPAIDVPAAAVRRGGLVLNARSLREAVILSEILGKPVSMREASSDSVV